MMYNFNNLQVIKNLISSGPIIDNGPEDMANSQDAFAALRTEYTKEIIESIVKEQVPRPILLKVTLIERE